MSRIRKGKFLGHCEMPTAAHQISVDARGVALRSAKSVVTVDAILRRGSIGVWGLVTTGDRVGPRGFSTPQEGRRSLFSLRSASRVARLRRESGAVDTAWRRTPGSDRAGHGIGGFFRAGVRSRTSDAASLRRTVPRECVVVARGTGRSDPGIGRGRKLRPARSVSTTGLRAQIRRRAFSVFHRREASWCFSVGESLRLSSAEHSGVGPLNVMAGRLPSMMLR